jgi:hypothetical protein
MPKFESTKMQTGCGTKYVRSTDVLVAIVKRLLVGEATIEQLVHVARVSRKRVQACLRKLRTEGCVYKSGAEKLSSGWAPLYAVQPSPFFFPDYNVKTKHLHQQRLKQNRTPIKWKDMEFSRRELAAMFNIKYITLWRCLTKGKTVEQIFQALSAEQRHAVALALQSKIARTDAISPNQPTPA